MLQNLNIEPQLTPQLMNEGNQILSIIVASIKTARDKMTNYE